MTKKILLKPWVSAVKDFKGQVVLYDLLHRKCEIVSSLDWERKKLAPELAFPCDEEIYLDKLEYGSMLDDFLTMKPFPPLKRCDLVLPSICPYNKNCLLLKHVEKSLLSYLCEICYIGNKCRSRGAFGNMNNIQIFIRKTYPLIVSISATDPSLAENFRTIFHLIKWLKKEPETRTRIILLNIPCYSLLLNYKRLENSLIRFQQMGGNKLSIIPNFTLIHRNSPSFFNSFFSSLQEIHERGVSPQPPIVTLVFDLSKWVKVKPWLDRLSQIKIFPVMPAFYFKFEDLNNKEKILHQSKDLFDKPYYFKEPDILLFTHSALRGFVLCRYYNALTSVDGGISNCKAYWLSEKISSDKKSSLKMVYKNWMWKEEEICYKCALRGGCRVCKFFWNKVFIQENSCFLHDNILGGKTSD